MVRPPGDHRQQVRPLRPWADLPRGLPVSPAIVADLRRGGGPLLYLQADLELPVALGVGAPLGEIPELGVPAHGALLGPLPLSVQPPDLAIGEQHMEPSLKGKPHGVAPVLPVPHPLAGVVDEEVPLPRLVLHGHVVF